MTKEYGVFNVIGNLKELIKKAEEAQDKLEHISYTWGDEKLEELIENGNTGIEHLKDVLDSETEFGVVLGQAVEERDDIFVNSLGSFAIISTAIENQDTITDKDGDKTLSMDIQEFTNFMSHKSKKYRISYPEIIEDISDSENPTYEIKEEVAEKSISEIITTFFSPEFWRKKPLSNPGVMWKLAKFDKMLNLFYLWEEACAKILAGGEIVTESDTDEIEHAGFESVIENYNEILELYEKKLIENEELKEIIEDISDRENNKLINDD